MEAIQTLTSTAAPLPLPNIDTDQIIPKQFLKRIERTGYEDFLFYDWRRIQDGPNAGKPNTEFVLNKPEYQDAKILIAERNFGCGSSREHAPWGLQDYGFQAIVAPSFADIFRNNCTKVGLLPVELPPATVRSIMDTVLRDPSTEITVDLRRKTVTGPGVQAAFEMDDFTRWRLLEGVDDIGLTLRHVDAIDAYERARSARLPSTRR
jgi:3-isopropylmalate/(R)-2-methylmalate dehydratase small subunit